MSDYDPNLGPNRLGYDPQGPLSRARTKAPARA